MDLARLIDITRSETSQTLIMPPRRIDDALSKDRNYGLAIFYKGVVLDLMGKPADAPSYFDRLLKECDSRELEIETRFNLGVVNYHRYSHPFLVLARNYFDEVIKSDADPALKSMAKAYLAQTHAIWMRPSHAQLPDKPDCDSRGPQPHRRALPSMSRTGRRVSERE